MSRHKHWDQEKEESWTAGDVGGWIWRVGGSEKILKINESLMENTYLYNAMAQLKNLGAPARRTGRGGSK